MKRRWAWLALSPVALSAALVLAASLSVAHVDDSALVARQAFDALGLQLGDCATSVDPLRRLRSDAEIDESAKVMSGPGWVQSRFVGSAAELATASKGTVAASGETTLWILKDLGDGRRSVSGYTRRDLPSGRVSWQPGSIITTEPCDLPDAGSGKK